MQWATTNFTEEDFDEVEEQLADEDDGVGDGPDPDTLEAMAEDLEERAEQLSVHSEAALAKAADYRQRANKQAGTD